MPAPLEVLPLYARAGSLVPLLSPEVETLAPATDPSVIDLDDRADRLRLRAFPAGPGAAQAPAFCLADATCFSSTETTDAYTISVRGAPIARTYTIELRWSLYAEAPPLSLDANGRALFLLPDQASLDAAATGAFFDATAGVLWVKAAGDPELLLTVR